MKFAKNTKSDVPNKSYTRVLILRGIDGCDKYEYCNHHALYLGAPLRTRETLSIEITGQDAEFLKLVADQLTEKKLEIERLEKIVADYRDVQNRIMEKKK